MLTYYERKARLPHGAVTAVHEETGFSLSTVSEVLQGKHRNRSIEIALAALMQPPTPVVKAFGPPGPERLRRTRPTTVPAAAGEG